MTTAPKLDKQRFAEEVCSLISGHARANALPENFFARLIWKESRFNPNARSPKGAQGIAQFMPGTAALRGLDNPYDHQAALAASALYLSELKTRFGNLGIAAAAYNFGEEGARLWQAGKSRLPWETRDYVFSITGRDAEDWRKPETTFDIPPVGSSGNFTKDCLELASRDTRLPEPQISIEEADWKPWGVVLAASTSEKRALRIFEITRKRHAGLIGEEAPLVVRRRAAGMGNRRLVQMVIGRDSRAEADALCGRLRAQGAPCLVLKN
ncbi:MAG: lytic transglycosylase domain-containing protein [Parvibaculaceae bacterium]